MKIGLCRPSSPVPVLMFPRNVLQVVVVCVSLNSVFLINTGQIVSVLEFGLHCNLWTCSQVTNVLNRTD